MASIRTTRIWNMELITPSPWPPSHKEEVAVHMPVTHKDDELLTETEGVRPTHVEIQRMIESALPVTQEATKGRRRVEMLETKVGIFLGNANQEAAKCQKIPVYQDV